MSPRLSVVICSLNGADGVRRCLHGLAVQRIRSGLELIVVDDGSTDQTSEVAFAGGAKVIRHAKNLGASSARNSGIRAASAPIVAFLDDDCEPSQDWAEGLLARFDEDVIAVGGPVIPASDAGVVLGYLSRHNPIRPQEVELAVSNKVAYRFWLYLRRQWTSASSSGHRSVIAMPSANMAVRRNALLEVGGFDERIRFGAEDDDLCRRLLLAHPSKRLIFDPTATVLHHFKPTMSDLLRRSRAYGQASAIMFCKWPTIRPTIFPFPALILASLIASIWHPCLLILAVLVPNLCYPQGLRKAVIERRARTAIDPYLQLTQEATENYGFFIGWWRFRHTFEGRQSRTDAEESRFDSQGRTAAEVGIAKVFLDEISNMVGSSIPTLWRRLRCNKRGGSAREETGS